MITIVEEIPLLKSEQRGTEFCIHSKLKLAIVSTQMQQLLLTVLVFSGQQWNYLLSATWTISLGLYSSTISAPYLIRPLPTPPHLNFFSYVIVALLSLFLSFYCPPDKKSLPELLALLSLSFWFYCTAWSTTNFPLSSQIMKQIWSTISCNFGTCYNLSQSKIILISFLLFN